MVLRFCVGFGNNVLLFSGPRDEVGAEKDAKPSGGVAVVGVSVPIRVTEPHELE
jgi:hypothetical protein